jgi:hypothetical protein
VRTGKIRSARVRPLLRFSRTRRRARHQHCVAFRSGAPVRGAAALRNARTLDERSSCAATSEPDVRRQYCACRADLRRGKLHPPSITCLPRRCQWPLAYRCPAGCPSIACRLVLTVNAASGLHAEAWFLSYASAHLGLPNVGIEPERAGRSTPLASALARARLCSSVPASRVPMAAFEHPAFPLRPFAPTKPRDGVRLEQHERNRP